ncbi:MAG TPA: hypothetical protein VNN99_07345 [Vicinamibacterales bacterium]|nr:hypothetical protein [Vicinamibacterales bacterium]
MPPRYAYWTILVGGLPTAFRAAERDELLPTFKRLQEKHPDAVMRWFSRGALWDSPEAARAAGRPQDAERPARSRDWRPGGEHRDPRQKFIDAKKARNLDGRKKRFERRQQGDGGGRPNEPQGGNERPPISSARPLRPRPEGRGESPARRDRPAGARPSGPSSWSDRAPKPAGREWKDRPAGPKPEGRREWGDRPRGPRPPGAPSGGHGTGRPPAPRPPRGPRGPKR